MITFQVPEPSTFLLFIFGLATLILPSKLKKQKM